MEYEIKHEILEPYDLLGCARRPDSYVTEMYVFIYGIYTLLVLSLVRLVFERGGTSINKSSRYSAIIHWGLNILTKLLI